MPPKILWQGKVFQLTSVPVNVWSHSYDCEIARRSPGVRVICVQNDKILLTSEYRRENNSIDIRLPGGKIFDDVQEFLDFSWDIMPRVFDAAKKELQEETGVVAWGLELFHVSHCGASVEWDLYYVLATWCTLGERIIHPWEEDITYDWYTYDDVRNLLKQGTIQEDRMVGVLYRFLEGRVR